MSLIIHVFSNFLVDGVLGDKLAADNLRNGIIMMAPIMNEGTPHCSEGWQQETDFGKQLRARTLNGSAAMLAIVK